MIEAVEPLLPILRGQQVSQKKYPHRTFLSARVRHYFYDNGSYHLFLLR